MSNSSQQLDQPADTGAPPRREYQTDLTDQQWRRLRPVVERDLPAGGRPRSTDLREVLSALNYRWRTGCPWRLLPHDFPPWSTIYTYYRSWSQSGQLTEIRDVLHARRATGREER